MIETTRLIPTDSHKSYYGKAIVIRDTDSNVEYLQSYDTIVCSIDGNGNFHRYWYDYSTTTMRHIVSFCESHGMNGMCKKAWFEVPCERYPYDIIDRVPYKNPKHVYLYGFNDGRVVYC